MAEQNPNGGGGKSDGQLLRCPHCAGPLTKEMETSHWTLSPLLRDSFSMIGSGFGGFTAIFYSYLHARPVIKRWIKGPMWVQILVGAPPNMIFASVCAGLAGEMAPQGTAMSISSTHSGCLLAQHILDHDLWFISSSGSTCIFILSCVCVLTTASTSSTSILVEPGNNIL